MAGEKQAGEYKLPKRWRAEEEYRQKNLQKRWTKSIINIEKNKYCGSTPANWCRHIIFYIIYYFIIFIIAAIIFAIYFYCYLEDETPSKSPKISIQPNTKTSLGRGFEFNEKNIESIQAHTKKLEIILDNTKPRSEAIKRFKQCDSDNMYGYRTRQPCVFVKMNNVIGFEPDVIKDAKDLPSDAPKDLHKFLKKLPANDRQDKIWLGCQTDNDLVKLNYFPERFYNTTGLFETKEEYKERRLRHIEAEPLNPAKRIIAVQLKDLPINEAVVLNCYVYCKNIPIDKNEFGMGFVELVVIIND